MYRPFPVMAGLWLDQLLCSRRLRAFFQRHAKQEEITLVKQELIGGYSQYENRLVYLPL